MNMNSLVFLLCKEFNSSYDIIVIFLSYEELNSLLLYTLHSKNTKEFNIHMTKLYPREYMYNEINHDTAFSNVAED